MSIRRMKRKRPPQATKRMPEIKTAGRMGSAWPSRYDSSGIVGEILRDVSDDKPVTITAIDNEKKLRDVLPTIRPMIGEGVIGLTDFEVIP